MRKSIVLIMAIFLAFAWGCRGSGNPGSDQSSNGGRGTQVGQPAAKGNVSAKPGQKPGAKPGRGEIDVDKLNIPDQVKEAIKSGKIPPDKVREIIAQAQGLGDALPVSVTTVPRKSLNSYLVLNGIVEPERKVEVYSRLAAYVKQILKEEGAYVQENEVLALLDDTEIKISNEQAKIELEQAKLSMEEAEKNFLRNQELIKKDLISEQEFQTQEAQYQQRQLDYKNRLENFKNLEIQLNYTKIRALSEGYITERLIEVGTRVTSNQQVYTIEDFKPLLVRVYVPTSDAINLKTEMPAEVTTEVLPGTAFEGGVKLINPRIDTQTGTVKVTVEIDDKTMRLRPGMFVEVRISIGQKDNVLVVPRKAILYKQNKTYVFVMNQNLVSQREVQLGLTEEDEVEITAGLNEGEVIVVVGIEGLKDGQPVEVVQ
jgi:RND family efflux transporter MFP subunit